MLDVPRDIPETEVAAKPSNKKEKNFNDVSIADLGGDSVMDEDPSIRQLLAEQMQIAPATANTADIPPAPSLAMASGGRGPVFSARLPQPRYSNTPQVPPVIRLGSVSTPGLRKPHDHGPMVPDFRGKSMRDTMETASEDGIEVMVVGSGMARAQTPLPGTPLHPGDKIRIVFTR